MSDLIERLRSCSEDFRVEYREAEGCSIYAEAADEIERLKAELFTMRNVFHQQDAEIERLRAALAKSCEEGRDEMYDCGYNRLRAALERIRQYEDGGALAFIQIQRIVDEALNNEEET